MDTELSPANDKIRRIVFNGAVTKKCAWVLHGMAVHQYIADPACNAAYGRLWPSWWRRLFGGFQSQAAVQMAALADRRPAAVGRLPTDVILRPPAALRHVAGGQTKK